MAHAKLSHMKIHPYISFKGNCKEALDFYQEALGAKLVFSQTFGDSPMPDMGAGDQIMHATLDIDGTILMVSDDPSPTPPATGSNISLAIGLSDTAKAEDLFGRLAAGGTVIMPLEKTFWAEKFGMVKDKVGVMWMINCEAPGSKA
jgi:PhnB protein